MIDIVENAFSVPYPSDPEALLLWAHQQFGNKLVFLTSFQREGMVLVDMAARLLPSPRVVTIDSGRLHAESIQMRQLVQDRYGIIVEVLRPDPAEVQEMVAEWGPDLYYTSVAHRRLCCQIRKVLPRQRVAATWSAYVTGLRREQSETRQDAESVERDGNLWKLSPLAFWTQEQVLAYCAEHNVPEHPLYAQGFASIGCEPCSRAILPGEPERAGRWWWEEGLSKECGLHFTPNGQARRELDVLLDEILERAHA